MKYSANKFNKSKKYNKILSITYNCYDTYCNDRANAEHQIGALLTH